MADEVEALPMIRALLLDLGNTLLDYRLHGQWRDFLIRRLGELYPLVRDTNPALAVAPEQFARQVGEVIGGERARAIERSGQSWHFRARLRQGLATLGLCHDGDALERLTDAFYEPIGHCTSPYPDTQQALSALRERGLRLAVITNAPWDTPGRLLQGDVQRWEIAHFFEAFICSGDAPWRKPNPAFMLAAAEALRVEPGACLVVGDTLEADIAGAAAAGMRSVWLNPAGAPQPDAPQPTWMAASLSAAAEIALGEQESP